MRAMPVPGFSETTAFVAVLEQKSFTRAAKQLGLSPARVSELISSLEERLGVRLVERTTRSEEREGDQRTCGQGDGPGLNGGPPASLVEEGRPQIVKEIARWSKRWLGNPAHPARAESRL
jgi:hypothetical protein